MLDTCASTNDWTKDHLDDLDHGDVVWTERQTAGRGQHGRRWCSVDGVLTASVVLRLREPPPALALVAGLSVALAIEQTCPDMTIALKWPNDCYLNGRKLAGILCEARTGGNGGGMTAIVGIGLNRAPRWRQDADEQAILGDLPQQPIGLADVTDEPPAMTTLLEAIRGFLLQGAAVLTEGGWPRLLDGIRKRDHLDGRDVTVEYQGETISGRAGGIDDEGRLLIVRPDGGTRALDLGYVLEAKHG